MLVRRRKTGRAAGLRGGVGAATAVPVPVLAATRAGGGGRGAVRPLPPFWLPLPGAAAAAALQYYLVPPRATRALRSAESRRERVVQIFIGER